MTHITRRVFQPQYLQAPRGFARPGWQQLQQPLCLEIGAGMGRHAILFGQQYPAKTLYAIERTAEKFNVFAERIAAAQLAQVHPVHADAIPWVVYALPPKSVSECFILYPNPEPRNPAQRWLNMPFFEFLLSRLQDDAQLTLASNIPGYIEEAAQQLAQVWQLPFICQAVSVGSARTHFEVKYLARGEPCQELLIRKPVGYQTAFDDYDRTLQPGITAGIGQS